MQVYRSQATCRALKGRRICAIPVHTPSRKTEAPLLPVLKSVLLPRCLQLSRCRERVLSLHRVAYPHVYTSIIDGSTNMTTQKQLSDRRILTRVRSQTTVARLCRRADRDGVTAGGTWWRRRLSDLVVRVPL